MEHCVIIGIVIAVLISIVKAEFLKSINPRLRKWVRRKGLVRGSLIYMLGG